MKNNKVMKNTFSMIICILLSFLLSGCALVNFDVRTMMEAPKNDADMAAVTSMLSSSGGADYCYPQNGDFREAVIFSSIREAHSKDAFAFTYDKSKRINISFFFFEEGKWKKNSEFIDKSDQVERVLFGDITGDGINDIIVGFTDSEDKNLVSVFTYSEAKGKVEKIDTKFYYTSMLCTNFTTDEKDELCVLRKEESSKEGVEQLVFSVYKYENSKFYSLGSEKMNTRLTAFENVFFEKDSNGKNYVGVEGMGTNGNYITQIITVNSYTEKFYAPYSANPERTTPGEFERINSEVLLSMDIDGDGTIEIPYMSSKSAVSSTSSGFITDWVKPTLKSLSKKVVMSTIINISGNYFIPVPEDVKENILFFTGSDTNSMDVYYVEADESGDIKSSQKLFTVKIFTKPMWKEYEEAEFSEYKLVLNSRADAVYAVKDLVKNEITAYMLEGFGCLK